MTPEEDDRIRQCFTAGRGEVDAVLKQCFPQYTTDILLRRAAELGLIVNRRRKRWTQPEIDMLESVGHRSLRYIQKRLDTVSPPGAKRTRYAILVYITKNRIRTNLDGLNHTELSEALGVTRNMLHRYRDEGLIHGIRKESLEVIRKQRRRTAEASKSRRDHQPWFYKNWQIRRFVAENPALLDLGKVSKEWFIDLLISRSLAKTAGATQEKKAQGKPRNVNTVYPVHGILPRG